MRKLFAVLVVLALVAPLGGCKTGGTITQDEAMLTAIELGGYNLGFYVGKSKTPDDDAAIAQWYAALRSGEVDPVAMAAAFEKLKIENPQLAGSLNIILRRMGATFNAEGGLVDASAIPAAYWDRAAEGYASGYEFGKINKKAKGGEPAPAVKSKVVVGG